MPLTGPYLNQLRQVARVRPATIAGLGTSITANGTAGANGTNDSNFLLRACMQSSGRYRWRGSFGRPGGTAQQIHDEQMTNVLALNPLPGYCLLEMGQNDLGAGASFSAFKSAVKQSCRDLLAVGVVPIIGGITPDATSPKPATAVSRNHWLYNLARDNGWLYVNWQRKLVDQTTGGLTAGLGSDATHPNATGAEVMADYLLTALDAWFGQLGWDDPPLVISTADTSNLFGNGLFLTDTNSDGTADQVQVNNGSTQAVRTLVTPSAFDNTDVDTLGKWQTMTRIGGATGATTFRLQTPSTPFYWTLTNGHRYWCGWRMHAEVENAAVHGNYLATGMMDSANQSLLPFGRGYFASTYTHDIPICTLIHEGTLTDATQFASGLGTFYTGVNSGEGVLAIAQVTIRDLTTLDVLDTAV